MTVLGRVQRARRALIVAVGSAALLWGVAAALGVVVLAGLAQTFAPLSDAALAAVRPLAVVAGAAALSVAAWRWRAAWSVERVALWIEEQEPELRFALVTAIDPEIAPADRHPLLHERARAAEIGRHIAGARRRALVPALLAVAVLASIASVLRPQELLREARAGAFARSGRSEATAPLANRLVRLRATVTPPAYTRLPETVLEEPTDVEALVGSGIVFDGTGPAAGIFAIFGGDTLAATADGGGWAVTVTMPESPAVVALEDREYRRLVVLAPQPDSAPQVRLRLPANDTVYQTVPTGRLITEARVSDDLGLSHGHVEYMLTTGGGELFDTKVVHSPRTEFGNARTGTLQDVVDLDTLGLAPGTVVHIRAIAYDYNDVTGPGRGVSETRTLRIAEPEDSVSVNPIPPLPIDSMWVSQRLLNMKTDTLIQERDRLDRPTFIGTSSVYSNTQEEIRSRAAAVISILEDDGVGGTFETQISGMLREAVDLMYEARVHLAIANPDSAMPYMVRVLEILDEIRLANRYYLRGIVLPDAINIERVRLTGEDPAADEARTARGPLDDPRAALAARLERAAALLAAAPRQALDSLTYIRVDALTLAPEAAAALAEAIVRLERGDPVEDALARTRRALEPPPVPIRGPVEWGGVP